MNLRGNVVGSPVPRPDWNQTRSTAADFIKNKPDIDAINEKANNALPNTGGTVDGNLSVGRMDDTTQRSVYVRRSINGSTRSLRIYWTDDGSLRAAAAHGGTVENYMELQADKTVFKRPVAIESGGTDATNAADALNNLGGLSKAGGTMDGNISMNGGKYRITGLADPSSNRDAAHKRYVDDTVAAVFADGAVTEVKIADGAVTFDKLAPSSVGTTRIIDTAVTTAKIKDGNVTASKIGSGAVTNAKIADGAVTAAKVAADVATTAYVDGKRVVGTCTLTASGWSNGEQRKTSSSVYGTDMPHWGIVYGTNREAEKEAFALVDELETEDGAFVFRCFGDVPTVDLNIQWEVYR